MRWFCGVLLLCGLLAAGEPANRNVVEGGALPVLSESTPFSVAIRVVNPNEQAVRIVRSEPTCTCAELTLAESFLLPHGETTLRVTVDNHNRSGVVRIGVSLYLSDPDLETIEVETLWEVRPHVAVDSLLAAADPLARPAPAFRDVYRYPSKVRPDELHRLRKRIRLSCPEGETPAGGLQVTAIDYTGSLWAFTPTTQSDGSILIDARAREGAVPTDGVHEESAVVHTNHPQKPSITLTFTTYVGKDAGATGFDPGQSP